MTLVIKANGENLSAAEINALALQTVVVVEDSTERDGYDFGGEPVIVHREDKRWNERYFPDLATDPRGARTPGWYPVDNLPYLDVYTVAAEFVSGTLHVIGSGSSEPYQYFYKNWEMEDWGDNGLGSPGATIAGGIIPNYDGIYRVTYRTSWNSNTNGKRYAYVYLNDTEIPGTRQIISAAVNPAGHATITLELELNGVTDSLTFGMMQDAGSNVVGRAYLTIEYVRPVQHA